MSEPAVVFDSMRVRAILEEACELVWARKGRIDTAELAKITAQKIADLLEEDNGRPILE